MTHSDTMWDLFERMRAGQVRTKENQLLDDRLRAAAIVLNSDWCLFDATVMKATVPNLSREEFEVIARATGQGPDRVFAHLSRVFDDPSHDVYHQMATAWHQSVPHLFEDIADLVRPMSKSYGALRVAAAISYLEGDPPALVKHFMDGLFHVAPTDPLRMNLSIALIDGICPANVRQERTDSLTRENEDAMSLGMPPMSGRLSR